VNRRSYRITHRTRYRYEGGEVTSSHGLVHVQPRELPWQQVSEHSVEIVPAPQVLDGHRDGYGNHVGNFHVTTPHTELEVTARSTVLVESIPLPGELGAQSWEAARPALRPSPLDSARDPRVETWRAQEFTIASPRIDLVAEAARYAAATFRPGRPLAESLLELNSRIHADFAYESGSTTVTTPVSEVFAARRGVCQDFAQVMISCLRSVGLAARYVSGYLATTPPPGRPRLVGADASHAWVSVWIPSVAGIPGTWWHLDPTNDRPCDESHATLAWGRDYADVAPVRGVIFTRSTASSMTVSVDMAPLDEH